MSTVDVLRSQRDELNESLSRLDRAAEKLKLGADGQDGVPPIGLLQTKIVRFQGKLEDLNHSIDDICNEMAIDAELSAATELRAERATIKQRALDEEAAAEAKYTSAKAKVEAELALDRSVRAQRREADELRTLRLEMDLRREARERAELLYTSDLSSTLRRLRSREADLERLRVSVTSANERRRLHDAVRRIRVGRLALSEQIVDYDYRGRRLARALDLPQLYDGLSTRYYSSLYPYYRHYPGTSYPYYHPYY